MEVTSEAGLDKATIRPTAWVEYKGGWPGRTWEVGQVSRHPAGPNPELRGTTRLGDCRRRVKPVPNPEPRRTTC